MSKDSYGEICKHFGIDKVEESIRHRQEKFVKTYKLNKNRVHTELRQHFFTERVVNIWNKLDEKTLQSVHRH